MWAPSVSPRRVDTLLAMAEREASITAIPTVEADTRWPGPSVVTVELNEGASGSREATLAGIVLPAEADGSVVRIAIDGDEFEAVFNHSGQSFREM